MNLRDFLGLPTLAAIIITTAALTAVATRHLQRPGQAYAVVDLTRVIRLHQQHVATQLARQQATPDDERVRRDRALAFGQALDRAAEQLATQCQCVLLMREAVVAGALPDLTARLSQLARAE